MGLSASLGAGLTQGYSSSANSGGSVNNAQNASYQVSDGGSWSNSNAWNQSWTDAMTARQYSMMMAEDAWQKDMKAMQMQMDFNREEAQKNRDWQEEMANSIYTRSVKNMKEAGINPILAANMGLSGASVGSGATASLGGIPSAPMAQNFMDSWSAGESASQAESWSHSEGEGWGDSSGSSWNSGWSNSENGIVTALQALQGMAGVALDGINSANALDYLNNMVDGGESYATKWGEGIGTDIKNYVMNGVNNIADKISNKLNNSSKNGFNGGGGGHAFKKKLKRA